MIKDVDVGSLVDEAYALYVEFEDELPLWDADLEQIERWFSTSPEHGDELRRRGTAMIDRAVAAAGGDCTVEDRASLLTAAAALRRLVATAATGPERSVPSPSMGIIPALPTLVPNFALATEEHGERYQEKLRRFPAAGHHYQLALAREDADLHPLHRDLIMDAFAEGWALYSERIADQMGLYAEPIDRLGMLSSDAFRAVRMVIDTGLHAFGWTRERAVTVMQEKAGRKPTEAEAEVDRYCSAPGQAASYMHGRLAIESARARAQLALGDRFDITAFHDVVLSQGTVSLDALDARVDHWAANVV